MNLNLMLNNEAFLHYKINFANNFLNPEFNTGEIIDLSFISNKKRNGAFSKSCNTYI